MNIGEAAEICYGSKDERPPIRSQADHAVIIEAGKAALDYMHAEYGPAPSSHTPDRDMWDEKTGCLIGFYEWLKTNGKIANQNPHPKEI